MQNNTITLAVDTANNGTTTDLVFSRHEEGLNKSKYISANHQVDARDTMEFYRTHPKKSGNFRGTAKTSVKFTRDVNVAGVDNSTTLSVPAIIEVNCSFPVGTTSAEMKILRQTLVALLDDDAISEPLNLVQSI